MEKEILEALKENNLLLQENNSLLKEILNRSSVNRNSHKEPTVQSSNTETPLIDSILPKRKTYMGNPVWDEEQEHTLVKLSYKGLSIQQIIDTLKEDYDVPRTPGALTARLKKIEKEGRLEELLND